MSVALVGLAASSQDTLDLTSRIVQEAACPVIAILETSDSELVNDAAIWPRLRDAASLVP